jgi:hypothetical protein
MGSVPAVRVALIEGSRRFRDHAEQQSRRITHHLPEVSLPHPLGAEFLQPGYLGRQVISVDIDMNPGCALAESLDEQPETLAMKRGPVIFGMCVEPGQRQAGSGSPECELPVMISRRDIDHDLGQPTVVCHLASLRDPARPVPYPLGQPTTGNRTIRGRRVHLNRHCPSMRGHCNVSHMMPIQSSIQAYWLRINLPAPQWKGVFFRAAIAIAPANIDGESPRFTLRVVVEDPWNRITRPRI